MLCESMYYAGLGLLACRPIVWSFGLYLGAGSCSYLFSLCDIGGEWMDDIAPGEWSLSKFALCLGAPFLIPRQELSWRRASRAVIIRSSEVLVSLWVSPGRDPTMCHLPRHPPLEISSFSTLFSTLGEGHGPSSDHQEAHIVLCMPMSSRGPHIEGPICSTLHYTRQPLVVSTPTFLAIHLYYNYPLSYRDRERLMMPH